MFSRSFWPSGNQARRRLAVIEDDPAREVAHRPEHRKIRHRVDDHAVDIGLVGERLRLELALEIDPQTAGIGDLVGLHHAANEYRAASRGQIFRVLPD